MSDDKVRENYVLWLDARDARGGPVPRQALLAPVPLSVVREEAGRDEEGRCVMVDPYNKTEIDNRRNHMMVPAHAQRERDRWLATIDARDQRIAALEAEVERLRGILREAREWLPDQEGAVSLLGLQDRIDAALRGGKE